VQLGRERAKERSIIWLAGVTYSCFARCKLRKQRAEISLRSVKEAGERQLSEAAQQDSGRFGELYELHFDRVYAYVSRRMGDRDAAQDVTSEVFHQALANLKSLEWPGAPFGAWLMRIASNAMADRWRRASRERPERWSMNARMTPLMLKKSNFVCSFFRLVRGLPSEQRRVIETRFAGEKSIREIAVAQKAL
jgi:RNA polymerase sigma-70 factor, ECF subfamily